MWVSTIAGRSSIWIQPRSCSPLESPSCTEQSSLFFFIFRNQAAVHSIFIISLCLRSCSVWKAGIIWFRGLINIIACSIYSVCSHANRTQVWCSALCIVLAKKITICSQWLCVVTFHSRSTVFCSLVCFSFTFFQTHYSLYHIILGEPWQIAGSQKSIRKQGLSQEYTVSNSEAWK